MQQRQLSLLFADIVGYSRLMGEDEAQTIELLGEYRRILLDSIQRFSGQVVEFIGDAVFARFDTPGAAVTAAIDIQQGLALFNSDTQHQLPTLRARIGIHMGEVTLDGNAVLGEGVNIAARLEAIAYTDGICVSESVYVSIKEKINCPVLAIGKQSLKNIHGKIKAFVYRPQGITLAMRNHYWRRKSAHTIEAYRYPIAACFILIIIAGFYFIPRWLVPGYTANYVEIADFKNLMSENGEADYFSAGITEALRSQLADIRDVYILDTDKDKGVRGPIRLEGSVQRIDDNVRIAYRLFRRKDNVQIAGGNLDGAYSDVFVLQDRVVAEIAGYLAEEFSLKNFRPAAINSTSDVMAYDYYLRGLEELEKPPEHNSIDLAIKYMRKALVHDNEYSDAELGICRGLLFKYSEFRDAELLVKAKAYCQRAIDKQNSNIDAYIYLGMVFREMGEVDKAISILNQPLVTSEKNLNLILELAASYNVKSDVISAERYFRQAVSEFPENWKSYSAYALFLLDGGRLSEAARNLEFVLSLTPENEPALSNLGVVYLYMGKYKDAAEVLYQSILISPTGAGMSNVGAVFIYAEEYGKAVKVFGDAIRLSPKDYRLYLNLADAVRLKDGNRTQSNEWYRQAKKLAEDNLSINGRDAQAYYVRALSGVYLGEGGAMDKFMLIAEELAPREVSILYGALRFWVARGDVTESSKKYMELVNQGFPVDLIAADPDLKDFLEIHNHSALVHEK